MQKHSSYVFAILIVFGVAILCWGAVGGLPIGLSSDDEASAVTTQATISQPEGEPSPVLHPRDVSTYHYNVFRQGQTLVERILTPSNVNSSAFREGRFLLR